MTPRRSRNPRGFFLTDTIIGIGILGILTIVLTSAAGHYHRGSERLTDSRQAARLAEQTLLAIQSNQSPPAAGEGQSITITPLAGEMRDLPKGCVWVRVEVAHNGRHAE